MMSLVPNYQIRMLGDAPIVYMFAVNGQLCGSNLNTDIIDVFDFGTNSWKLLCKIPHNGNVTNCTTINGIDHIVTRDVSDRTLRLYNPITDTWKKLISGDFAYYREHLGIVEITIYAFEGVISYNLDTDEVGSRYDPYLINSVSTRDGRTYVPTSTSPFIKGQPNLPKKEPMYCCCCIIHRLSYTREEVPIWSYSGQVITRMNDQAILLNVPTLQCTDWVCSSVPMSYTRTCLFMYTDSDLYEYRYDVNKLTMIARFPDKITAKFATSEGLVVVSQNKMYLLYDPVLRIREHLAARRIQRYMKKFMRYDTTYRIAREYVENQFSGFCN